MKCSACRAQLDAYREGDVGPAAASSIASHLHDCSSCQAFLDQLAALELGLQQVRAIEPRPDFTQLVMAKVALLPTPAPAAHPLRIWWIGVYELVAWMILLALTGAGILHWQSIVADTGVFIGKTGLVAADLYRLGQHFHLVTYAAAGVALECIAFGVLLTVGRKYLARLQSTVLGAQPV